VMTEGAVCMSPDTTVREAAQHMKFLDVGSFPVCHNNRLVGMLTDRDIAVRSVCEGHDPASDRVRDIMTPKVFYCFEDQDVDEAAHIMSDKQVRRLPVLDRHKRLAGMLSIGDLAVETGKERMVGEALEGISEHYLRA
jgi:CBS domain-containing protein